MPATAVRDQFARVVDSPGFVSSARLCRFLAHIVNRTIDGDMSLPWQKFSLRSGWDSIGRSSAWMKRSTTNFVNLLGIAPILHSLHADRRFTKILTSLLVALTGEQAAPLSLSLQDQLFRFEWHPSKHWHGHEYLAPGDHGYEWHEALIKTHCEDRATYPDGGNWWREDCRLVTIHMGLAATLSVTPHVMAGIIASVTPPLAMEAYRTLPRKS